MHGYDAINFYFQKELTMATLDLITQALADQFADVAAQNAVTLAIAAAQTTDTLAAASALALYSDLTANGPAVTVDATQSPPIVTEYTPVAPASFTATILRVAT